jgi:hypothetical protein
MINSHLRQVRQARKDMRKIGSKAYTVIQNKVTYLTIFHAITHGNTYHYELNIRK